MSKTLLVGQNAWNDAKRKARYGHRDWIAWVDRDGVKYADVCGYETVKRAMLASGTQGRFVRYCAGDRHGILGTWRLGTLWLRNSRYGV